MNLRGKSSVSPPKTPLEWANLRSAGQVPSLLAAVHTRVCACVHVCREGETGGWGLEEEHTRMYLYLGKRQWALGREFSDLTPGRLRSLFIRFQGTKIAALHLEGPGRRRCAFQFQPLPALPPPLPPMNEMVKPDTSGRRREGGLIHASIL